MLEKILEAVASSLKEISESNAERLEITEEELLKRISDGRIETLE